MCRFAVIIVALAIVNNRPRSYVDHVASYCAAHKQNVWSKEEELCWSKEEELYWSKEEELYWSKRKSYTGAKRKSCAGAKRKSYAGAKRKSCAGAKRKSCAGAKRKSYTGAKRKSYTGAKRKSYTGAKRKSCVGAKRKSCAGAKRKSCVGAFVLNVISVPENLGTSATWEYGFDLDRSTDLSNKKNSDSEEEKNFVANITKIIQIPPSWSHKAQWPELEWDRNFWDNDQVES